MTYNIFNCGRFYPKRSIFKMDIFSQKYEFVCTSSVSIGTTKSFVALRRTPRSLFSATISKHVVRFFAWRFLSQIVIRTHRLRCTVIFAAGQHTHGPSKNDKTVKQQTLKNSVSLVSCDENRTNDLSIRCTDSARDLNAIRIVILRYYTVVVDGVYTTS